MIPVHLGRAQGMQTMTTGTLHKQQGTARDLFREARASTTQLNGLQPSQLQAVARFMERLVTETDMSAVYAGILDGARELLGADRCAVFRRNARSRSLECVAGVGLSQEFLSAASLLPARDPTAAATLRGELSVFEDVVTDPRTRAVLPVMRRAGFRALVVCPITFRNRFMGALTIHYDTVRHITEPDKSLIRFFAALAGAVFENGRVHTENGNRAERLRVINEVSLALSGTLDLADLYEMVYHEIGRVLKRDSFYIALYDSQRDEIRYEFTADRGVFAKFGHAMPLGAGPSAWVIRNRRPYVLAPGNELVQRSGSLVGSSEHSRSAIHVPMMLGRGVVGAISVQSYSENAYDDQDLRLLQVIASHTAVAVENARLFAIQDASLEENRRLHEQSAARAERLAVVNEVGMAVSRVLDLESLYQVVYEQLGRVLSVDAFYIGLWDRESNQWVAGVTIDRGIRYPNNGTPDVGNGACRWVLDHGQPFVMTENTEATQKRGTPFGSPEKSRSAIHVPMLLGERVMGVLSSQSYTPNAYTADDVLMLQTVAGQTAVAVENARLFSTQASARDENARLHAQSARLAERLRVLNEAGLALSGVLNLDVLWDVVAQQTARVVRMDSFYIALWNAERQTLTYSFFEDGIALERNIEAGVGAGPSGWVVKHRLPHLACTSDDPIHRSGTNYGQGPAPQSACHVPLMLGERVIGVMSAQSYAPNAYSEEDVQILQTLAGQAAVAVENARLYRAVQEASLTDELTGLPNRRAAARRVEEELSRAARYGYSLCVLLLDLDFFKSVNDTFGHPIGDSVLREISVLLRASLRSHDSLGRWGGEEFIVMLVHTDLEGGRVVAENLRRRVEQFAFLGGRMKGPLTVSIGGMAIEPLAQWELGAVVATVDACLYKSKETGRNRVVFLDQ